MTIFQNIISRILAFVMIVAGLFGTSSTIAPKQSQTALNPLAIESMRDSGYPGSSVSFEQTLMRGSNYNRYIISFTSDGLKEYAYVTIPFGKMPSGGFPLIIFNHGYQIPNLYTPDGNYIAYMDALAKESYIIFKPDYRGNGKSEGSPTSAYFSPDYVIDDLNAIASAKKLQDPKTGQAIVNTKKIGMWGHSMGGNISLKASEVSPDLKAVVIWGGVVGNINDIIYNWADKVSYKPDPEDLYLRNLGLAGLLLRYGTPTDNPSFWNSVDPTANLKYVNAPFQINVGGSDNEVPPAFSKELYDKLTSAGKVVEYYSYPGANHDISQGFTLAMKHTIDFFNRYLK